MKQGKVRFATKLTAYPSSKLLPYQRMVIGSGKVYAMLDEPLMQFKVQELPVQNRKAGARYSCMRPGGN